MAGQSLIAVLLLAQVGGPPCGWNYGIEITPEDSPYQGCTVPDFNGRPAVRLRMDPFTPGGVRAEPLPGPSWLPPGQNGL